MAQSSNGRKRPAARRAAPVITQNRLFLLLIAIVTGFAITCLVLLAALAFAGKDPPTTAQKELGEICKYVVMVCIGALVGLLGGRAAAPDRLELADRP